MKSSSSCTIMVSRRWSKQNYCRGYSLEDLEGLSPRKWARRLVSELMASCRPHYDQDAQTYNNNMPSSSSVNPISVQVDDEDEAAVEVELGMLHKEQTTTVISAAGSTRVLAEYPSPTHNNQESVPAHSWPEYNVHDDQILDIHSSSSASSSSYYHMSAQDPDDCKSSSHYCNKNIFGTNTQKDVDGSASVQTHVQNNTSTAPAFPATVAINEEFINMGKTPVHPELAITATATGEPQPQDCPITLIQYSQYIDGGMTRKLENEEDDANSEIMDLASLVEKSKLSDEDHQSAQKKLQHDEQHWIHAARSMSAEDQDLVNLLEEEEEEEEEEEKWFNDALDMNPTLRHIYATCMDHLILARRQQQQQQLEKEKEKEDMSILSLPTKSLQFLQLTCEDLVKTM